MVEKSLGGRAALLISQLVEQADLTAEELDALARQLEHRRK